MPRQRPRRAAASMTSPSATAAPATSTRASSSASRISGPVPHRDHGLLHAGHRLTDDRRHRCGHRDHVANPGSGYTSAPTVTVLEGGLPNPTRRHRRRDDRHQPDRHHLRRCGLRLRARRSPSPTASRPSTRVPARSRRSRSLGAVTGITVTAPARATSRPASRSSSTRCRASARRPRTTSASTSRSPSRTPRRIPARTTTRSASSSTASSSHRSLPATLLRGYVQLSTTAVPGKHVQLTNANLDPTMPADPARRRMFGVDNPHYLGPTIVATKDKPVRILFRNLLPTGTRR